MSKVNSSAETNQAMGSQPQTRTTVELRPQHGPISPSFQRDDTPCGEYSERTKKRAQKLTYIRSKSGARAPLSSCCLQNEGVFPCFERHDSSTQPAVEHLCLFLPSSIVRRETKETGYCNRCDGRFKKVGKLSSHCTSKKQILSVTYKAES